LGCGYKIQQKTLEVKLNPKIFIQMVDEEQTLNIRDNVVEQIDC
jgi:hypothetical protein